MYDPGDPVAKLKALTSQLDKATAAGKEAVKQVVSARETATKATKLAQAANRKQARKRSGKKR